MYHSSLHPPRLFLSSLPESHLYHLPPLPLSSQSQLLGTSAPLEDIFHRPQCCLSQDQEGADPDT